MHRTRIVIRISNRTVNLSRRRGRGKSSSKARNNSTRFSDKRSRIDEEGNDLFTLDIHEYNAFEKDIGIINVFFKEKKIMKYVTENRMSFFDFLSQIGGSLGLVMGISIISLFEIIYWFTFRLFENL